MATFRLVRVVRLAVILSLVVYAVLVGTAALPHAHDSSVSGLYSAECSSCELARHSVGIVLSPPTVAVQVGITTVKARLQEQVPADVGPASASPRAPPLR